MSRNLGTGEGDKYVFIRNNTRKKIHVFFGKRDMCIFSWEHLPGFCPGSERSTSPKLDIARIM